MRQWDLSVFRQLRLGRQSNLQFRFDAFNVTNRPRFSNPGGNVSNLQLNPDGTFEPERIYRITAPRTAASDRCDLGIRLAW